MKALLSKIIGEEYPIISNTKVEIGDWKDYSKLLECDIFTVVSVEYEDDVLSVYVDDEGLLKPNYGRMIEGYPEPLFGNIIVCGGVDEEGNTMDIPESLTLMNLDELISDVRYKTNG